MEYYGVKLSDSGMSISYYVKIVAFSSKYLLYVCQLIDLGWGWLTGQWSRLILAKVTGAMELSIHDS